MITTDGHGPIPGTPNLDHNALNCTADAGRHMPDDVLDFGALTVPAAIATSGVQLVDSTAAGHWDSLVLHGEQMQIMITTYAIPRGQDWSPRAQHDNARQATASGAARRVFYTDGPLGTEVIAERYDGTIVRYLARGGPRWLLRAVVIAPAAAAGMAASLARGWVSTIVVDRGSRPYPAGTPIELSIPRGWETSAQTV